MNGAETGVERDSVAVIGAGLAGSEAAWQLARRGIPVHLFEMRPRRLTPAHQSGDFAELVCSNSFKSTNPQNAHGLLKAELAAQGALVMESARRSAVPAGQALAVDRDLFSAWITAQVENHELIRVVREEGIDPVELMHRYGHVIVATGPLTSDAFSENLGRLLGRGHLSFYDAIAPTVIAESIDLDIVFRASRYGKGDADYLNCPMDQEQYHAFVQAVIEADRVTLHTFESLRPFEGCLPIEVMAERGALTLAYGPMKPVGLTDPRTGRRPFAVIQLRQEDRDGRLFGMVGFQTKMTWPEQRRIFRTIPGLERAEFARLGSLHRNTFIDSPSLLDADLAWKGGQRLSFAGQITGVEGYMESAAMGLYVAKRVAYRLQRVEMPRPSAATMTGALVSYVVDSPLPRFQPMNSSFGLLAPAPAGTPRSQRKAVYVSRALAEMERLERLEWGAQPMSAAAP